MRLFYAIEFPDLVRARLASLSRELAAVAMHGRWTRQENIHLTMQFLGECPAEWLPVFKSILVRTAASCPEFNLTISGCGAFGSRHDLLWLGARKEPSLDRLAEILSGFLREEKMPFDDRPFAAHITIGRDVQIDAEFLKNWQYEPIICPVQQITLMQSSQDGGPVVYTALERVWLAPL
jgi:RNA 2',3'-cyclic 3'-phosphodiesterase